MDLLESSRSLGEEPERHPWELARLDVIRRLLARHAALAPGGVVLDVGCGDAFAVGQLAAAHPSIAFYAIDTAFADERLVDRIRANMPPNIHFSASLDAIAPVVRGKASLVLLMDVIEHIEDDRGFVADLSRQPYIGDDTRFVVTVPAHQCLFCSHDVFLKHYRRYSAALLRRHLEQSGLHIVESGQFFFSLVPIRLLQTLKERMSRAKPEASLIAWNGGRARSDMLRRILALDAAFGFLLGRLGITLPGLSTYAVCRKSA